MFYFQGTRKPDFSSLNRVVDYDEYWRDRGLKINDSLKKRESLIKQIIPKGSKVIDIGCGNSRLPLDLKKKGCDVTVADISRKVLKNFLEEGLSTKVIDLVQIKSEDITLSADYIILSEVLEHIPNPEEVVKTLSNEAKFLIITIPNSAFYRYRFHLMFRGRFFTQWVHHPSEHLRYWSHIDFLDWLKGMNCEVVEVKASNGFTFFGLFSDLKNVWKNMFGHQIIYVAREKE